MVTTGGINHVALVYRDMPETADFYTRVLRMPLVKTVEVPAPADLSDRDFLATGRR